MKNKESQGCAIDISKIPNEKRYFFSVKYIFPREHYTCAAFEKEDFETGFHVQEFYELCLISKGEGYHIIEDTVVRAVRGDVFIVPPGRKHAFIGGKGFNVYYIHLSPDFLQQYSARLRIMPAFHALFEVEPLMRANGTKYRHLYLEDDVLTETLGILANASKWTNWDTEDFLMHESYILIVLTILCREYAKLQTIVGKNVHNDRLIMESISVILERYNENLTIEKLAQIAKLSRTSYIKRFIEVVGMPPRQYIMHLRINAAKNLLKNTDRPIARIAEETGFYDSAHLNKCFTASTGTSPTDFRRQNKAQGCNT